MTHDYITPLFWQHGEAEEVLREEIQRMKSVGIQSFVAEPRPHPDYLSDGWWRDMAILVDEAKKNDMKVWIFDDGNYPSGWANGLIPEKCPEHLKVYLAENHIDVTGPRNGAYFLAGRWIGEGEELLYVVAAQRKDRGMDIIGETLTDITDHMHNGRLYWDVPEGEWRIFIIKQTHTGEEAHTSSYINPLSREAVRAYIDIIHEEHYKRFGSEFGKTIQGFFTDEPRFGNTTGYDRAIGRSRMPLPYCDGVLQLMQEKGIEKIPQLLPCLWYNAGGAEVDVRYVYMDVVSGLFAKNFTGQLGDWCRAHQVKLIGHLVEENGAHARLGYGAGHYFRAVEGMDAAGLDIVCNLYPEQTSGSYYTGFNFFDSDFSHWGLSKMASSAACLDPKKKGVTICETFGAYGWNEGLKVMKWITDVLTVRGVNHMVPHAFSPQEFPDPDCPPHFYARGENPQFRHFDVWSSYANDVCGRITDGLHKAPVAVLYHAEAEWGGEAMPFEKVVKVLMQRQIDSDVVSADMLVDEEISKVENGVLGVHAQQYRALVVPYAQYLPAPLLASLKKMAEAGLKVWFIRDFPQRAYLYGAVDCSAFEKVTLEKLPEKAAQAGIVDIKLSDYNPDICYIHYEKEGTDSYFLVNQSTRHTFDGWVELPAGKAIHLYDPMRHRSYRAEQSSANGKTRVQLYLQPYESLFLVADGQQELPARCTPKDFPKQRAVDGVWRISSATSKEYPAFTEQPYQELVNLAEPNTLPEFAGIVRYELSFEWDAAKPAQALLDLGNVYECATVTLNGEEVGTCICPPYQFVLEPGLLKKGNNQLVVEVVNTLVKSHEECSFDWYFPQEPTGLLGPVSLRY